MEKKVSLKGKRFHIAGSIPKKSNVKAAEYSHSLIKNLAKTVLSNGGGLVVTLGNEPFLDQTKVPSIFDWTILEAVDEISEYPDRKWPVSLGIPVIAVAFEKNMSKLPPHRKELWARLLAKDKIELHQIPTELSVGGIMRQEQSKYGDFLVTIGGHLGVYHLAQLYQNGNKPIIPLDINFNDEQTASNNLSHHAAKDTKDFFNYTPNNLAATAYSKLSLKNELMPENKFCEYVLDFISHIPKPIAFYVRLLDSKNPDFASVEGFFRKVVDPIVLRLGYRRFEMSKDFSEEIFMNVELFEQLRNSSLVIVDLTGIRPNCCLELGFALGLGKKFILTAQEGTSLPWDASSINCHFWKKNDGNIQRKNDIKEFIRKNINKNPVSS